MHDAVVRTDHTTAWATGALFASAATLAEQRQSRRATLAQRVELAAQIAARTPGPVLIWCELNTEGDELEDAIPDAVQVKGSDSQEAKEARLLGFADGSHRVLITKPSIAGFGLNWQHCATMVFLGATHSYEQTYQAIRRCWRFGQTKPVDAHVIRSEADEAIVASFRRKEADAQRMGAEMAALVADCLREIRGASAREWNDYEPRIHMTVPSWAATEAP
jgi:hypothetical protein